MLLKNIIYRQTLIEDANLITELCLQLSYQVIVNEVTKQLQKK